VPTLVVLGDKDAPDIHAIGQIIHAGVSGSRLVTCTMSALLWSWRSPTNFNRVVGKFLLG